MSCLRRARDRHLASGRTGGPVRLVGGPTEQRILIERSLTAALAYASTPASWKQLTLVRESRQRLGCVQGDGLRLQQTLRELLVKAIIFTAPTGTVTVTSRRQGASIAIAVRLEPMDERVALVGEAYLRVRLAIATQLARVSGGSLTIAIGSAERGAIFTLMLPAVSRTASGPTLLR